MTSPHIWTTTTTLTTFPQLEKKTKPATGPSDPTEDASSQSRRADKAPVREEPTTGEPAGEGDEVVE
jgi:hypothetical protein